MKGGTTAIENKDAHKVLLIILQTKKGHSSIFITTIFSFNNHVNLILLLAKLRPRKSMAPLPRTVLLTIGGWAQESDVLTLHQDPHVLKLYSS